MKPIERFDPDLMGGSLLEAEHLARYRWAGALAEGKRVLDAGCGTGYGSELLASQGAAEVVGVDVDADAIDTASRADSRRATFAVADLRDLPADLGEFDVVVCFEVLEHIREPEVALDRLAAVLRPGGILVTCSCSYHVSAADLLEVVASAAMDSNRSVRILENRGQSKDHPNVLGVPETAYLKCIIVVVS